jgi:nucleoside-diphosphate-sugar epimerase
MDGVSEVIHCATGSREVIVEGTRRLAECAYKNGVNRFIYLSSIAVYGKATGIIEEGTPLAHMGDEYADAKIDAERICLEFGRNGLPVSILRPTIVYGPHGAFWTEEVIAKLAAGQWGTFGEVGQGKCNLLYVDDLVGAIVACLYDKRAVDQTFNVSGPEVVTWNEYFSRIQKDLGLPALREHTKHGSTVRALMMEPVRVVARYVRDHHMGRVKWIAERSRFLKRLIKDAEERIKGTPSLGEFALWSLDAIYSIERAKATIGFVPCVGIEEGLRLTHQWYRHQQSLGNGNGLD